VKIFFNQLFDYNFHCNKKLIELCSTTDNIPEKSIELFSHLLNAHQIWNSRILGTINKIDAWQLHPVEVWGDIHYENQRSSFDITSEAEDFELRIDYENSEGRLFTNTLQDILFHIINHSTHHRAQIMMDLRQHDIEPLPLDYVFYKR